MNLETHGRGLLRGISLWRCVWALSLLTVAIAVPGEDEEEGGLTAAPEEMQAKVKIVAAREGELPVTIKSLGQFVARPQAPAIVTARVGGIVSHVEARVGDEVASGTILIRLDPREAQNDLAKAQAALRAAESELRKAQKGGMDLEKASLEAEAKEAENALAQARIELGRKEALLKEGLVSGNSVEIARQAADAAGRKAAIAADRLKNYQSIGRGEDLARLKSETAQARAEAALAEYHAAGVTIRSPQAGKVSALNARVGAMVEANSLVAQIAGDNTAALRLGLAPGDADRVKKDAEVSIHCQGTSATLAAHVVSVGGELDPETGLATIEAELVPHPGNPLRIGDWTWADIALAANARGIIAPVSALVFEDDKASVRVVDENHIAHAIPVEVLARSTNLAAFRGKDLHEGDHLIVEGNYNLPDGAHVVEEPVQ